MKYSILRYALILLIVPFIMSCESMIEPQDKWPKVVGWELDYCYDVSLNVAATWLPTIPNGLKLPGDFDVNIKIDIQTYYSNQAFDVKFFLLEVIDEVVTIPIPNVHTRWCTPKSLNITETIRRDYVHGTYQSGEPPQGITQLEIIFKPSFYPSELCDWYYVDPLFNFAEVDNRYIWKFRAIIEDDGGRTDTFTFDLISDCKFISPFIVI